MIIVTGGAGFIGSAFVWKLNQEGIDDILIVDELGDSEKWKNLVGLRYQNYIHKEDFLDLIYTDAELKQVDAIIHMGACSSTTETDGDFLMENNFRYTQILAEWCLANDVHFIYASSAATYGDGTKGFSDSHDTIKGYSPINRYGYSKHFFDLYAYRKGWLDTIVGLKFFNVFGPNEYHKEDMKSLVCKAHKQILETGTLKLFKSYKKEFKDGGQQRDFVYVKDVVDIMWWLLNNRQVAGLFNIGTGQTQTWNDLAESVFKALGKKTNIEYIDMPDNLKDQYQYFTEAPMKKLQELGCPIKTRPLAEAVDNYINQYLNSNSHLSML
jgi:ADP-L-glycero-D-manno-heptose 6-epimerase